MMKSENNVQKVVLSYHHCLLRQGDVNLLHGPYWLNDTIIGFYFEYLEHKYEDLISKFLFICPELTQLLKVTAWNVYYALLDPIEAKEKEFIFFPVNDCSSLDMPGGTHWSLLVFSKAEKTCFYFDSSRGLNSLIAKDLSRDIMHYLLGNSNGSFIEIDCPQQDNSYDCGLFVLCYTDIIVEHILKASKVHGCNCDIIKTMVFDKRKSLINLIYKLKEFKE